MMFWTFVEYLSPGGRNPYREWYRAQVPAVQVACDYAIQETAATEDLERCVTFSELYRIHVGLCQVRFRADDRTGTGKRQFRVVGFWDYDRSKIILVKGGRKPIPEDVFTDSLEVLERYFRYGEGATDEHF